MKNFNSFFVFEAKRFFCKRNSIIAVLLLLLAMIFVQVGSGRFKNTLVMKQKFQDIEKQKIEQYVTYTQYGGYGIRILFLPAPISILFTNSGVVKDMEAFVDSGERLKIYLPLLGKNLFAANSKWPVDFAGMILFFGSLLSLFYGFDSLSGKEYLRFLVPLAGPAQVFVFMILSRIILLFFFFLAVFGCGLGLVFLNGITLPIGGYSFFYCLVMLITAACFFAVGALFGTFKFKITASIYALCCWFILIFVVPMTIAFAVESKANDITSIYQLELEKLKIAMDFEKRSIVKAGTFNYGKTASDLDRELVSSYWQNDFKKILALEEDLKQQMQENIALYHRLSMLSPAGFYFAVCNEISGAGYKNAIEYLAYVQQLKSEFVKFYINKMYFENFSRVIPFITGDQNIYNARPRLPGYYFWGLLMNALYIGLFLWGTYYRYKKALYTCDGVAPTTNSTAVPVLKLEKGDFKVWEVRGDLFRCQIYNLLSGWTGKTTPGVSALKLSIDGQTLGAGNRTEDFFYFCHGREIPGQVKAGNFLDFIAVLAKAPVDRTGIRNILLNKNIDPRKKIKCLSEEELGNLMVCLLELKPFARYLVNDIARGMTPEFAVLIKEKIEELTAAGATVLFLNTVGQFWLRKNASSRYFIELPVWGKVVDSLIQE